MAGIEFETAEERERVAQSLRSLWHAMRLSHPPVHSGKWDERYAAWLKLGEALLGEDCPDLEILG